MLSKLIKSFVKVCLTLLALPLAYLLISAILSYIPAHTNTPSPNKEEQTLYLSTNGVHLDIVFATKDLDPVLKEGLKLTPATEFISIGWGDENFYLNTPTWGDLTFETAFKALFLKSPSLMHVTNYTQKQSDWTTVPLSRQQMMKVQELVLKQFQLTQDGAKIHLPNSGYTSFDTFYKANESYSLFYTCNTWANEVLKEAKLPSSVWTPFDFGVMHHYD